MKTDYTEITVKLMEEFTAKYLQENAELIQATIEATEKALAISRVVGSLPIQDLPKCTRVEVIDQKGRSYVNWKPTNKVRLSMQDDGRTAKIFID